MTPLSMETWLGIGIIATATLMCCAHVLATLLREHDRLATLQASCDKLRSDYDRRMKEIMERLPARETPPDSRGASHAHGAQEAEVEPLEVVPADESGDHARAA